MKRLKGPLIIIFLGLIILLISQSIEWRWDLTGDKRFSLSEPVESVVEEYREVAYNPYKKSGKIEAAATVFLSEAAKKLAQMVSPSQWGKIGRIGG